MSSIEIGGAEAAAVDADDAFPKSRAITIENPIAGDNITFFYAYADHEVSGINFVLTGTTSATMTIRFAPFARNATGTEVITGGTVVDQLDNQAIGSFDAASIPAGSWVWIEITAISGTPDSVAATMTFE